MAKSEIAYSDAIHITTPTTSPYNHTHYLILLTCPYCRSKGGHIPLCSCPRGVAPHHHSFSVSVVPRHYQQTICIDQIPILGGGMQIPKGANALIISRSQGGMQIPRGSYALIKPPGGEGVDPHVYPRSQAPGANWLTFTRPGCEEGV